MKTGTCCLILLFLLSLAQAQFIQRFVTPVTQDQNVTLDLSLNQSTDYTLTLQWIGETASLNVSIMLAGVSTNISVSSPPIIHNFNSNISSSANITFSGNGNGDLIVFCANTHLTSFVVTNAAINWTLIPTSTSFSILLVPKTEDIVSFSGIISTCFDTEAIIGYTFLKQNEYPTTDQMSYMLEGDLYSKYIDADFGSTNSFLVFRNLVNKPILITIVGRTELDKPIFSPVFSSLKLNDTIINISTPITQSSNQVQFDWFSVGYLSSKIKYFVYYQAESEDGKFLSNLIYNAICQIPAIKQKESAEEESTEEESTEEESTEEESTEEESTEEESTEEESTEEESTEEESTEEESTEEESTEEESTEEESTEEESTEEESTEEESAEEDSTEEESTELNEESGSNVEIIEKEPSAILNVSYNINYKALIAVEFSEYSEKLGLPSIKLIYAVTPVYLKEIANEDKPNSAIIIVLVVFAILFVISLVVFGFMIYLIIRCSKSQADFQQNHNNNKSASAKYQSEMKPKSGRKEKSKIPYGLPEEEIAFEQFYMSIKLNSNQNVIFQINYKRQLQINVEFQLSTYLLMKQKAQFLFQSKARIFQDSSKN